MATSRDDILIDIRLSDLDSQEFMAFARTPEFATWLLLAGQVWRSTKPHSLGLEQLYAQGLLAASISEDRLGEMEGGVNARTIRRDIDKLEQAGRIKIYGGARGNRNVYVLGEYDQVEGNAWQATWYALERVRTKVSSQCGQKCPHSADKNVLHESYNKESQNDNDGRVSASAPDESFLPYTDQERQLFARLREESEACGKSGEVRFPSLACRKKFGQAADRLNSHLDTAIACALEKGILSVAGVVGYVAKWEPRGGGDEHLGGGASPAWVSEDWSSRVVEEVR